MSFFPFSHSKYSTPSARSRRSQRRLLRVERLQSRQLLAADAVAMDDLAGLSDEFDTSSSIAAWQRVHEVEGWNADQLQVWNTDQSQTGRMVMQPHTVVWYQDWRGPMVFKEVTGDFIFTSQIILGDRDDVGDSDADDVPDDATFSLGGVMIRTPRDIENPITDWRPGSRADDGTNNGENYVFLSMGHGVDRQFSLEVKTTRNSRSQLQLTPLGAATNTATLRIARIDDSVITMYRLPGQDWTVHRRYSRPDMPATLQLGLVTYTDWNKASDFDPFVHNSTVLQAGINDPTPGEPFNPDLVVGFEYARFARPQVPAELNGVDLVNAATDQQLLSFLGDADVTANTAPQIQPINNQTILLGSVPLLIDLVASDADGDSLSYEVRLEDSLAAQIMAEHHLHEMSWRDDYALNWGGQNEKWLQGDQGWYFLLPDGTLNLWGGSFATSTQLAAFSTVHYDNPHRLLSATDPNIGVDILSDRLVISAGSQTGAFPVEVIVSDGSDTSSTSFVVDVTNTAPLLTISDQLATAGEALSIPLPATDADGHTITYTVEVLGDQLSMLDTQHGFWSNGNYYTNYLGQNERWIRDASNHWHYLLPTGQLYRWEGSFAASLLIAELGSDVYQTPALLTDPQPTTVIAAIEDYVLTISSPQDYRGEVRLLVRASDGFQTVTATFRVNFVDPLVDTVFFDWELDR